ncbi:type IV pilin N-terminal domain-containing protein [Halobellus sp. H-GB7]|uniref:type IV pilin N-terminal domain-containing protein n=1 Tax=Halobellus sp. H-GB7 TaxID=3069756 RepID=UPI0027B369A8|nr:type IV pilin N-terminal domain-containing protein [Halobellus sp. H-GB7]MDQ2054879.1 type IV pilin N-terminal domain-containing protein [Halobellus sp. H-GB7]
MKLKQLFTDDSAVSPVIGVILMVAITVILAAVIGSFVLNLGQGVQQTAPQASFSFDYNTTGGTNNVTITHQSGDSITGNQLNTTGTGWDTSKSGNWSDTTTVSAGTSITKVADSAFNGETIRVVWTSQNGETSATLSQSTAPGGA